MNLHHRTEVEVHHEVVREPNEVEDSNKPEVMFKVSKQTKEHKEDATTILAEDSGKVKILIPKDHTVTDKDPKETRRQVPTINREVDTIPNLINMPIIGTV